MFWNNNAKLDDLSFKTVCRCIRGGDDAAATAIADKLQPLCSRTGASLHSATGRLRPAITPDQQYPPSITRSAAAVSQVERVHRMRA